MKFLAWLKLNIGSVLVHIAALLATLESVTNTINLPASVRVGLVTASGIVVAAERVVQTLVPSPTPTVTTPKSAP